MYTISMFRTSQSGERCPLFQGCPYFRCVLISRVSLFQGCPYFKGVLISGVSLFQGCPYFRGVLISRVSFFQGCPYFRVPLFQGCPYFRCAFISGVSLFEECLYFRKRPPHKGHSLYVAMERCVESAVGIYLWRELCVPTKFPSAVSCHSNPFLWYSTHSFVSHLSVFCSGLLSTSFDS